MRIFVTSAARSPAGVSAEAYRGALDDLGSLGCGAAATTGVAAGAARPDSRSWPGALCPNL